MFKIVTVTWGLFLIIIGCLAQPGKEVSLLFEVGENHLNSGQYKEAIQAFSSVITIQVDYIDAYYYRGTAKEKINDLEGALIDYSIALEWKNDFAEALFNRGQILYKLNRLSEAKEDFEKLLSIPHGETHDILYRKSTYEGVSRIFTAQGVTDIVLHYLGLIALKNEEYTEAINWFDSAISIYNADPDYFVYRGEAKEKLFEYEGAKADYNLAIQKSPDHGLAQQHLSLLARALGNIEESDRYLSVAIERNPHLPYAYLERAYHRSEVGDYIGAIEDYTAALEIDSLDAEVWVNRGLAIEKTGAIHDAYDDFTQAIKLDEALGNAWLCRANVLVKLNKLSEAIEDYGIAIYCDPNYSLAYYNRALIQYRMGEKTLACHDLIKAEELGLSVQKNIKTKICESESY